MSVARKTPAWQRELAVSTAPTDWRRQCDNHIKIEPGRTRTIVSLVQQRFGQSVPRKSIFNQVKCSRSTRNLTETWRLSELQNS
ncbi:hypothetical protein BDW60DRAFT_180740 [Aspergillus nidulans var. acristatus]